MKRCTQFPADLMILLVPVFVVTVIGMVLGYAFAIFNWLMAHC